MTAPPLDGQPDLGPPGAAPAVRNRHRDVPPGLDRRFEAVVIWSATADKAARTVAPLTALGRAGVVVGVIAPVTVDELIGLLAWPASEAAELLLADSRGPGAAVIDEYGLHCASTMPTLHLPFGHRPAGVVARTMAELWRRGVDPRDVLLLVDGLSGSVEGRSPAPDPDVELLVTTLVVNAGRESPPAGAVSLSGGAARLRQVLADQLRRRRQHELPAPRAGPGWSLVVEGSDLKRERVDEALLTLADGHVGTSGASLAHNPSQHPWVVAAGLYDGAGADTHLLTGPRVFELAATGGGIPLRRVLDLRTGVLYEHTGTGVDVLESVRFASLSDPTTSVLRVRCPEGFRAGPPLMPPTADPVFDQGRSGAARWIRVAGSSGGMVATAMQHAQGRTLDRIGVYRSDPDILPDPAPALDALDRAGAVGFDRLLRRHRRAWARRWENADVVVDGDDELQLAMRLALFHMMASVADSAEAAVGARGLTGTGYRGHVFWDADIFVLPFLAATHPAAARAMLEYRVRRLPAAMDAAVASGRVGARFPWESARSGRDVTPTSARNRAGRIVPIRTGQLEEHIVADVAWAACWYVDWSGDIEFARGPGRRILVETARYWASRISLEPDGSAHIRGVIGPDEYHESVNDDVYTNVMARWNLRRAAEGAGTEGVDGDERSRWLELADALVDGYDSKTGIYEQFAGFGKLEPLIIAELAPRRPIAADLLLGAERVAGAQVIKQADVLLLHHLVPDEVVPGSLEPNLRFYEPRTAHGSSLSPATHASLLARTGDCDAALDALRLAARMDLDDLTGSTAAGLHLATMGGLWQAVVLGFGGVRPRAGMLQVDPVLPSSWSALELRVRFHGSKVRVRAEHARLYIETDRTTAVVIGGTKFAVGPGMLECRRRGPDWEPIT